MILGASVCPDPARCRVGRRADIVEAVLVERKDAKVSQAGMVRQQFQAFEAL